MTLTVGSLFSGIGGMDLGLEWAGMEVRWQCEIDPFCLKVLEKHWPNVKRYTDVRSILDEQPEAVDVVVGGYPCQPFSSAGKRQGEKDDRHLWPAMFEIVQALRPTWVLGENVAGHISMGLDAVLSDLEGAGYATRTFVIPACAKGAPHRRDRVWVMAHCLGKRPSVGKAGSVRCGQPFSDLNWQCQAQKRGWNELKRRTGWNDVAHNWSSFTEKAEPDANATKVCGQIASYTDSQRLQEQWSIKSARQKNSSVECGCRWLPEPAVGRVAHGIPRRVDRLRALGNSVVPQVVHEIGRAIVAAHEQG